MGKDLHHSADMALQSSIRFIDSALFSTGPFALSYYDPDQKWLIRSHFISLLQNFPSLRPSTDTFTHNDGANANLLNATGDLLVSPSTPVVPITIWVHENYPHMAPIVLVSSNTMYPIHQDHPFIDPSGLTTLPYLQNWLHPRSNLLNLVHNLVNLFSYNHPFYNSNVLKMEAMDKLSCSLVYDTVAFNAETEEELERLSTLQGELVKRFDVATGMIIGLEDEKMDLERRVTEMTEEADVLMNWLRVHDKNWDEMGDEFEAVGEESRAVLDCLAKERALEDLIYALDKAVEQGVVSFDIYIGQVRKLAREQFLHRALVVKLMGPEMHTWSD
ncbi:unnamed protein product [Camellia sinensis]